MGNSFAAVAARRATRRVRRLEQLARTSERLAELGTLTGGLAHEIKNPLSTVGLNAQLIQEDLEELEEQEPWNPLPESKCFVVRGGTSLAAWIQGNSRLIGTTACCFRCRRAGRQRLRPPASTHWRSWIARGRRPGRSIRRSPSTGFLSQRYTP